MQLIGCYQKLLLHTHLNAKLFYVNLSYWQLKTTNDLEIEQFQMKSFSSQHKNNEIIQVNAGSYVKLKNKIIYFY
jgi:hypothetical protein